MLLSTNKTCDLHGEALGWINPISSIASSCFFSSTSSDGFILYGLWDMGPVLGISSMINSISQSGGIPGKTYGNKSGYSQTIWIWSMVGWAILFLHLN